jgi:hypothetical protein
MTKTATTRRTHLVAVTRAFDDGGGS